MTTYNHAFDIAFEVPCSKDPYGEDVTPEQIRTAITNRLCNISDEELLEAVGTHFDSYVEEDIEH